MNMIESSDNPNGPNKDLTKFNDQFCLTNVTHEATRTTNYSRTLFEICLTSHSDRMATSGIFLVEISDYDLSCDVRKQKPLRPMHPALLLSKLRAYGFEENFINLLRSYLCGRSNRVKLASRKNSWKRVNRGCPQGSALGPLLWNIFQNDLVYEIERNLSMYADDHQLFEISDNVATINDNLNANARKASSWYESNLLKGNLSKYHTMLINNKQRDGRDEINVNVQGTDIDSMNSIKLLGVTMDNKLNFK